MANNAVIEKWVTALESGKYEQTRGYLNVVEEEYEREPVGMCCLGVLTELAVEEGVIEPGVIRGNTVTYRNAIEDDIEWEFEGETYDAEELDAIRTDYTAMPPKSVLLWAGLDSDPAGLHPVETYDYTTNTFETVERMAPLTQLNDSDGLSFTEIAAVVRKTYLSEVAV